MLQLRAHPALLAPEVSLALYRVAQEALTNATKHAPGATTEVDLAFDDGQVRVGRQWPRWRRTGAARPLAGSGGGYGLQGIRERVRLLGGQVEAGPAGAGWRVRAEVPA